MTDTMFVIDELGSDVRRVGEAVDFTEMPERRASGDLPAMPLDRGVQVDDAIEYARKNIGDDEALGYTVRRVARGGTIADLAALVTALRDDLRN